MRSGMKKAAYCASAALLIICFFSMSAGYGAVEVGGELKKWHTVIVTFDGPQASEGDTATFLDYRLSVQFNIGAKSYVVPGFFAADGSAGSSGATSGAKWRAYFCPDSIGTWTYTASFHTGSNVAVDSAAGTGTPDTIIDGKTGTFTVTASDKTGRDFRGAGRLQYVQGPYLQFAESGEYFLKGGVNSPQNFLAYDGFDNTPASHTYAPHVSDWTSEDGVWSGLKGADQGKGILGAINYLSSQGLNSVCVRVFTRPGPFGDVFPYVDSGSAPWQNATVLKTFDVSKLDQWETVFDHLQKKGMLLHLCLTQAGNQSYFEWAEGMAQNSGTLAVSRRLFYREMAARFAHYCAMEFNLLDVKTSSFLPVAGVDEALATSQVMLHAACLRQFDAYKHPIVIGTEKAGTPESFYTDYFGDPNFEGTSIVDDQSKDFEIPRLVHAASANAGRTFVVFQDQTYGGLDPAATGGSNFDAWDHTRATVLWPLLFTKGAGIEINFKDEATVFADNFRTYETAFKELAIALSFMRTIPYAFMETDNVLTYGQPNCQYLVQKDSLFFLHLAPGPMINEGLAGLNMEQHLGQPFTLRWFDPRTGTYHPAFKDTIYVPNSIILARNTGYGYPPGMSVWSDWTNERNWILILKHTKYSGVKYGFAGQKTGHRAIAIFGKTLYCTLPVQDNVRISLIQPSGKTVKTIFKGTLPAGTHAIKIDEAGLSRGVYLITMKQQGMSLKKVERYVKQ